jgi:dTDP-4-dehydrorhamnose reductase
MYGHVLITGAGGQLGRALVQQFPAALDVTRKELDLTDRQAVETFDWFGIELIINAAAYTDVDGAETPEGKRQAWLANAQGVANLVRISNEYEIRLVHISSEYVFDGTQSPHTEVEPISPLGVYGQTKAAGDIVASMASQHYIVRTGWLIGDGSNFVRTMMRLAAQGASPAVVDDQIGRLTFTDTLAGGVAHLLETEAPYGTYNLSNEGKPASWADVARAVYRLAGRSELQVQGISSDKYFESKPDAAPRPLQSTLDLTKIESTGFTPPDWRETLAAYVTREVAER